MNTHAIPIAAVDPVFAAIDKTLAARSAVDNGPDDDDVLEPIAAAYWETVEVLGSVRPTTPAGMKRQLEVLFEIEHPNQWYRRSPMVRALVNAVNTQFGTSLKA